MPSASIRRKAAVVVAAIVRAVVALGRSLNMVTTAEDVAQLNYLKGEACDEVQGFYFGRAVSADEFVEQRLRGSPGIAPVLSAEAISPGPDQGLPGVRLPLLAGQPRPAYARSLGTLGAAGMSG